MTNCSTMDFTTSSMYKWVHNRSSKFTNDPFIYLSSAQQNHERQEEIKREKVETYERQLQATKQMSHWNARHLHARAQNCDTKWGCRRARSLAPLRSHRVFFHPVTLNVKANSSSQWCLLSQTGCNCCYLSNTELHGARACSQFDNNNNSFYVQLQYARLSRRRPCTATHMMPFKLIMSHRPRR